MPVFCLPPGTLTFIYYPLFTFVTRLANNLQAANIAPMQIYCGVYNSHSVPMHITCSSADEEHKLFECIVIMLVPCS